MKFKYYMRGFGTGVLFATILLMIAMAVKDNMPANKHTQSETTENHLSEQQTETTAKGKDNTENTSDETTISSEDESNSENENVTSEEETTSAQTEETTTPVEPTSAQEESTSEEPTSSPETESATEETSGAETPDGTGSQQTYKLTIYPGMSSNALAKVLEENGVVESGDDFNLYIYENHYEGRLRIGVYDIRIGAPYSEITDMIVQ